MIDHVIWITVKVTLEDGDTVYLRLLAKDEAEAIRCAKLRDLSPHWPIQGRSFRTVSIHRRQ